MIYVIDANAIGHAQHNGTILTHQGMQTQAIYGFVRMLRDLHARMPQAGVLLLWDGYAQKRFDILPDYKGDRARTEADDPEVAARRAAYRNQVPVIKRAIELLGVPQWVHPHQEADDLAGFFCAIRRQQKKTLMTGDTDWLQLVDENTTWVDPRAEGHRIELGNFLEATGYHSPSEYLEGKVLIGDTSDSIPGIDGVGEKTAAEFIAKWRSIAAFHKAVDTAQHVPACRKSKTAKSPHPEQVISSPAGRERIERNMKLMDLRDMRVNPAEIVVTRGGFDALRFRDLCDRLGFISLTRNFDEWIGPFALKNQVAKAA